MLAIVDSNPFLSDSSKQATQVAAQLASAGRMTVLMVDQEQRDEHNSLMRMNVLTEQLRGNGCSNFEVVDSVAPPNASATCGEVADQRGADLLVLSADAVHDKSVDANLLAEFVPCPMLVLP
jgi:glycerol-3-phosphate cytidylyltransferase-like family protein